MELTMQEVVEVVFIGEVVDLLVFLLQVAEEVDMVEEELEQMDQSFMQVVHQLI